MIKNQQIVAISANIRDEREKLHAFSEVETAFFFF